MEAMDDDESLRLAREVFSRTGQEEHKLLKADGHDPRAASLSLVERLLTTDRELTEDMDQLEPVMECTGFSTDEAARTLLLWEEISSLREKGLGTVDIVQHLTRRLKCSTSSARTARGRLMEAGRNAAEFIGDSSRKQKLSAAWGGEVDGPHALLSPTTKRNRFH
jgi:hypothetical protein